MGTITLPGGRVGILVPADEAGEWFIKVSDDPAEVWHEAGWITRRQLGALRHIRECYGKGGGLTPGRQSGGGGRPEDVVARYRAEYRELEAAAPAACRYAIRTACQGEWPVCAGMPAVLRDGLDAVGTALRLPWGD